jgi:hypothetical protein
MTDDEIREALRLDFEQTADWRSATGWDRTLLVLS